MNDNKDSLKLSLLNGGTPLIKKKKRSPQKRNTPLSKEYKVFLKQSLTKNDVRKNDVRKNDVRKNDVRKNDVRKNDVRKNDVIKVLEKKENIKQNNPTSNVKLQNKKVKIVRVNKNQDNNFVKIVSNKDINKSKNKFTKKSQEKKNKRNSKRKKIHRKITKVKTLSFKCNDNKLNIKNLMQETQKKSTEEIKAELKKKGIEIKSNKNKLLKDLYLFTSCNNINIVKE